MATTPSIQGLQRTAFLDAQGMVTRPWILFFDYLLGVAGSPSGVPTSLDGVFAEQAAQVVDESGAFGEAVIVPPAAVPSGTNPLLTFTVPGSLQPDPHPVETHVMPSDQSAPNGFVLEVAVPDPVMDTVVNITRVPPGSFVPDLIITGTIPAGQNSALVAVPADFPKLSTVSLVVVACSGGATPSGLVAYPA